MRDELACKALRYLGVSDRHGGVLQEGAGMRVMVAACLAACVGFGWRCMPGSAEPASGDEPAARRYVMLKFDDLRAANPKTGVHWKFQRLADYLAGKGLKASFGVIANSLETENAEAFAAWVRKHALENGGLFEFWHHGYDHAMGFEWEGVKCVAEFCGPPYERQREHFAKACALMREKTGIPFRTFGAAGNAADAATVRVVAEHPDVKVWLYGPKDAPPSVLVLERALNLEYAVGKIAYDRFLERYPQQQAREYLVLQGHPTMWSEESWTDFQRIVEFLAADKWEFVTPYEYFLLRRADGAK